MINLPGNAFKVFRKYSIALLSICLILASSDKANAQQDSGFKLSVETKIQSFLSQPNSLDHLFQMFPGKNPTSNAEWESRANTLKCGLLAGKFEDLTIEVKKSEDIQHVWAGFSPRGKSGKPVIYLNENLVKKSDQKTIDRILMEEIGHWIDYKLNGEYDSPGDEGQLFAATLEYSKIPQSFSQDLLKEDDHLTILVDGVETTVELASILFSTADAYSIWTDNSISTTQLETNIVYVKERIGVVGDRILFISIPESDPVFSGNNTRGWLYVVEASAVGNKVKKAYLGEISRLYKVGSSIEGLQFYVYPDQNNEGYLADRQTLSQSILIDIKAPDFTIGQTYNTSSDPVASALNSLMQPDPISAGADNVDGLEKGGLNNAIAGTDPTGNVITNDAGGLTNYTIVKTVDPWIMAATSSSVRVSGFTSSLTGITSVVPGPVKGSYGTLNLNADGSFSYILDNNNTAVQALRLTTNTLTETFTYNAFADNQTGTGTLTLTIKGANDNPIAVDDYNIAKESLLANTNASQYTASDPGFKATGNVLTNDTDVDKNGETFKVSGIEAKANVTTISESTTILFVAIPSNVSVGRFVWMDGDGVENNQKNGYILKDKNGVSIYVVGKVGNSAILSGMPYLNGQTQLLPAGTILGFSQNETGASYAEATISGSDLKASAFLQVNQIISGGLVAGMTVSGTGIPSGVTVTSFTYKANGAIDRITLSADIAVQQTLLTFTYSLFPITMNGKYGKLLLNDNGTYEYTPFAQNPDLNEGQKGQESFPYTMEDALALKSNAILYISVTGSGTNDPDAKAQTAIAKEAGGVLNGTAGIDPTGTLAKDAVNPVPSSTLEVNEVRTGNFAKTLTTPVTYNGVTYDVALPGLFGTLYVKKSGDYIYVVDNTKTEVEQLKTGNTLTENFQYFLTNGLAIDGATFVVTLQGAYDAPVAVSNTNMATVGSAAIEGTLLLNDSDVDASDTKVLSKIISGNVTPTTSVATSSTKTTNPTSVTGTYGTLLIGADGTYIYTIDANNAAIKSLVSTSSLTEVFRYEVKDGGNEIATTTLTITINAPNKAPVNTNPVKVSTAVGAAFSFRGSSLISVTDVDGNLYSVALSVENGTLSLTDKGVQKTGIYTYVLYGTEQQIKDALATLVYTSSTGFSGTDELTIQSVDEEGLSHTTKVEIEVSATNLTVNSIIVNEATGKAYFVVSGAAAQQVKLATADGTGTDKAVSTQDYTASLEYYTGSAWSAYTANTSLPLDANGKLQVRIPITNDATYEGSEVFRLIAYNSGNTAFEGTCTIKDDGTGTIFKEDGTEDANAQKDDDRALTVNSIIVNESSPYAVFQVSGQPNQLATLALNNVTTTGITGLSYSTNNGTSWSTYTSGTVALNSSGKLLVRTSLTPEQEAASDNGETFTLTATNTGGSAAIGTATVKDDGTGAIFKEDGTEDANAQKDDDRPLTVTGFTVNEASPYGVFIVNGNADQQAKLLMTDVSAEPEDHGATLQYLDGTWKNYTANTFISLGTSGKLYVRTSITNDTESEGAETFKLIATNTGGSSAEGIGTIVDDGTGSIFKEDGTVDQDAVKNDDRALTINSIVVNESSPYAVFQVSGQPNQLATLALNNVTTTGITGLSYSTNNGTSWTTYTSGTVALNSSGKLWIRTSLTPEQEEVSDNGETFTLTATNTGAGAATGTATVKDDGTGTIFKEDGTEDPDAVKNDDRPLTVNNITVNEKSPYGVFLIKGAADQLTKLSLTDGTAGSADYGAGLEYYNGSTWTTYAANTFIPLDASGNLYVRTPIKKDNIYEGAETFTLNASNTGGTSAVGTGTIKDDGTGDYWINDSPTPATPQELVDNNIDLDDDRLKIYADKNVTFINVPVNGSVATNDVVTPGSTYGTPVADANNPTGSTITLKADGTYTFNASKPGEYLFDVPVCAAGQTTNCPTAKLQITVLDPLVTTNIPIVNPDLAITEANTSVKIHILANDKSGNEGKTLDPTSVVIMSQPTNGTVAVNADGTVVYTPNHAYIGTDKFTYKVCETGSTTNCQSTEVYITVRPFSVYKVYASDDYASMNADPDGKASISGTVLTNDGSTQLNPKLSTTLVEGVIAAEGKLVFNTDGTYTFTPAAGFTGTVDVVYTLCDDRTPASCATATLHILVIITDSDGDGVSDIQEIKDGTDPKDPCNYKEASQNLATVSAAWKLLDCDGDGTPNGTDPKPFDPCVTGTGNPIPNVNNTIWQKADCDSDGIPNNIEGIADKDGDGIPNFRDTDSDGDGLLDKDEAGSDPTKPRDTDGDGQPDYLDIDSDNDGITDDSESGGNVNLDTDKDGIADHLDLDSDGDGLTDVIEADGTDADQDGRADGVSDAKGVPASAKGGLVAPDTDKDGKRDFQDVDTDGDGIPDNREGQGTYVAPSGKDTDKDGIDDAYDKSTGGVYIVPVDTDRDGKPDWRDLDSDNDGIPDEDERGADGNNPLDTDKDGIPDYREVDSDNNGVPDNETLLIWKTATKPVMSTDGTYTLNYTITLRNERPEPITNVQIKEDLTKTFPSPMNFQVMDVRSAGVLTKSVGFDGRANVNLLASGVTLNGKQQDSIIITVKIYPNGYNGDVNNTAEGTATTKWGPVTRQSIDITRSGGRIHGAGLPTVSTLPNINIFIADVITPNNDGKNDKWIIVRPSNVKVSALIFNRWGQVIYKNPDYKNDWDGRSNVGSNSILPAGTYYYVLEFTGGTIVGKDVRKGYLSIFID